MDPAARIHIAKPSPPYCAACYQAKPGETHVDFGAATDGPMLAPLEGAVGVIGHSVDDIVICSTCIAEAARLVGLENAAELREQLDAANATNDTLHERLDSQRSGVTDALELVKRAAHGETTPPSPNSSLPILPAPARKGRPKRRAA